MVQKKGDRRNQHRGKEEKAPMSTTNAFDDFRPTKRGESQDEGKSIR